MNGRCSRRLRAASSAHLPGRLIIVAASRHPESPVAPNRGTISHRPLSCPLTMPSPLDAAYPTEVKRPHSHGAPSSARGADDDGAISSAHPRRAGSSSRGRSRTAPLKLPPPKKCRPFSFLGQKMPTFVVLSSEKGDSSSNSGAEWATRNTCVDDGAPHSREHR